MDISQIGLSFAGLLLCLACVAALAFLLTWRERAASFPDRMWRLVAVVLPASGLLLGLLLWTLFHVMLLWSSNVGGPVAAR